MAKIGVIVPVYNVEGYLGKCVDSILAQTFPDFELILVDDGSSDASGAMCDGYAEKDRRVRVIHTENQGVAAARNRGLKENQSEYIAFVDSDDWVAREYLETLHRLMEAYQADLVISCGINVVEGRRVGKAASGEGAEERISRAEAYQYLLLGKGNASVAPWAKLYRRTMFQSGQYPVGEIYEDSCVLDRIVESCGTIVYTPYTGYYYFRRLGSLIHRRMTPGHMVGIRNAKRLWAFARNRYPEIEDAVKVFYLRNCIDLLNLTLTDPAYRPESKRLRKDILSEMRFFFSCGYFTAIDRICVACLLPGLPWYRMAWRVYLLCTGKISGTAIS